MLQYNASSPRFACYTTAQQKFLLYKMAPLAIGAPTATAATNLANTSYTANWGAVSGATSYRLDVSSSSTFGSTTTVASDGLNNSTTLFALSDGAYFTGNSGTGDRPASSPLYSEGTHSRGITNGTAILTSNEINLTGYSSASLSFRLASFSISSTNNGADAGDIVTVEISPNGGTTYYSTIRVLGNNNAFWSFSEGTGIASTTYDGNTSPVDFAPAGGGSRTTDGYSTVEVLGLPISENLRIKVTMLNNATGERWLVDDFKVIGNSSPFVSGYENLNVGNVTSYVVTDLEPGVTYYYRVRAVDDYSTSGNSNVIEVTTLTPPEASTYSGTGNWSDAENWFGGFPGETTNVTINGNVTVDDIVECNNMTISSSGAVTVASGQGLSVNGDFLIESDENGTGSFIGAAIDYDIEGNISVERYLVGYDDENDQMFHLISSPVAAQAIREEFVTNTPTAGHDFYSFDEVTNMWINTRAAGEIWNTAFEENFAIGKGYLVAYPSDVTKNFTGVLNSDEVELTCSNTAPPTGGNGWNLLGNPFPSAIDWNALARNGLDDALYYYDNAEQKYRYYLPVAGDGTSLGSGSRYIPAMQGFMVHASTNGATLTIPKAAKTHNGQNIYYKSTATVPGSLSLKVAANGHEDEAFIHFNNQATTTFDGAFDAYKLRSYSTSVPNLFTKSSDGNDLAINGLPELGETTVIPVYLEPAAAGTYSISANLSGLPNALVYLKDSKTNTTHNLSTNPVYSFTAAPGDDASRFSLHFASVGLGETPATQPVLAYYHDGALYVNNTEAGAEIMLFGISGQLLKQQTATAGLNTLQAGKLSAGVYVVRVQSAAGTYSSKVIVTR